MSDRTERAGKIFQGCLGTVLLSMIVVGAPLAIYCGVDEKGARQTVEDVKAYFSDEEKKPETKRVEFGYPKD